MRTKQERIIEHDPYRYRSPVPMPLALGALGSLAVVLVFAALVFVPAGRLDWTLGWIYVGLVALNVIITWVCLLRWNPVLIERRMRFAKGTKTWDKWWAFLYAPVMIAVYVVAGIEAREGVSSLPWICLLYTSPSPRDS